MFDHKGELLEIGNPRSVSGRDFALIAKVLQSIMISKKDKFFMKKIIPPVFNGLHDGIEFNIIRTISETSST